MTAESVVNLRSGPGLTYPVIGRLRGGQSADVLAQNAAGDWLQVSYDGQAVNIPPPAGKVEPAGDAGLIGSEC